jgi:hypothetical protein
VAVNLRNTYVRQWNFSVQRQITSNRRSMSPLATRRLSQFVQRNDPPPGQARSRTAALSAVECDRSVGIAALNIQFAAGETRKPRLARFVFPTSLLYVQQVPECSSSGKHIDSDPVPIHKANCDFSIRNFVTQLQLRSSGGPWAALPQPHTLLGGWCAGRMEHRRHHHAAKGLPFTPTISVDQAITGVGSRGPT